MTFALGVTGASGVVPITECLFARPEPIPSPFRRVASLLDRGVLGVTGKGGVWRTTVAARPGMLAGVLGGSRLFQYLTAAAPGLSELVTIGKVWDLAQLERRTGGAVFDLAIVDAPPTGHGLAMLRAPATYASVARVGPISRQARIIDSFLRDRDSTGVLVVALPEEMPVNETIDFERRLADELSMAVDHVVVNGVYPQRFNGDEARRLRSLDGRGSPAANAALRAALAEHERARGQRSQLRRLRRHVRAPVATLPYLFEPQLGRRQVERLANEKEREP